MFQGHDAGSRPSACSCPLGMWGRGHLTGGLCQGVGGAGPGTPKSSRRQDQRTFCELGDRETEGAELLAIASRGRPTSSSEADGPRGHGAQRQESPEVPAPPDAVSTLSPPQAPPAPSGATSIGPRTRRPVLVGAGSDEGAGGSEGQT